jgi:hypothetical protein
VFGERELGLDAHVELLQGVLAFSHVKLQRACMSLATVLRRSCIAFHLSRLFLVWLSVASSSFLISSSSLPLPL